MDAEKILSCLNDDVAYTVYEGGPTHIGKDKILEIITAFFRKWKKIEFEVKRISVMGNVTMHERAEDYHGVNGQDNWHFHVTSLLVFKDGKITLWRDYGTPGERQAAPGASPLSE
jgi:limonene-1,2-epoxide hydrolase